MQYADDDDSSFDGNRKSIHLNPLTHTRKSDDKIDKGIQQKKHIRKRINRGIRKNDKQGKDQKPFAPLTVLRGGGGINHQAYQ